MDAWTKFDFSKEISGLRNAGKMDEAVGCAMRAQKKYPEENIFEKLLGDLFFQMKNYERAGAAYIRFLEKIKDQAQYVKNFAHFMQRYSAAEEAVAFREYCGKVETRLDSGAVSPAVIPGICEILAEYIELPEIELFGDDMFFKQAVVYLRRLGRSCRLYILYYKVLSIEYSEKNKSIGKHLVSSMEKRERYREALRLLEKVLNYDKDQVAIRTLFRICRKLEDYSVAERYILQHPEIKRQEDFNVLYELVFYYSRTGNMEERDQSLIRIEKCGNKSVPILRTLYNFYLQFGMPDKAVGVNDKIAALELKRKENYGKKKEISDRKKQEEDAALAASFSIQELYKELEQSRKLISMSDLLKGFSHELGQPVTNIRYGIQLYQIKMEKGVQTEEELKKLFENILSQTLRMKSMLSRFSPIVSEKEGLTNFYALEEIKAVFQEFSSRLSKEKIEWELIAGDGFALYGDRVKFSQIFYNLIGNSIYAIRKKNRKGRIAVCIEETETVHRILFEDNGTGIAPEYIDKVFDPFFTTKEHSSDENGGGEGLGLYIVWNIVRMFDGKIKVDRHYRDGARFVIEILKKKKGAARNESDFNY